MPNVAGARQKLKPHHSLDDFQAVFAKDRTITATAKNDALALGLSIDDVAAAIDTMTAKHFQKSITSHGNHRQWQDVYHLPYDGLTLYVKFTDDAVTEFTLLSFKEK